MKRFLYPCLFVAAITALLTGAVFSADAPAKREASTAKSMKAPMARYLVISPHTPEECLGALDEIAAEGPQVLSKFDFGCMAGDHTGYAIVSASSYQEALKLVPASIRDKAKAVKLSKFTGADIKAIHEKMKS